MLTYFLLDWFENDYRRGDCEEEPVMPDDLVKAIVELKEYIEIETGIDVDRTYGEYLAESDTYLTPVDVLVFILRDHSKYWHQCDEEYHFKNFERQGRAYLKKRSQQNRVATVKCLQCSTTLRSYYRHNFQQCDCPNRTFVDGGRHYWRVGGIDITKVEIIKADGFEGI